MTNGELLVGEAYLELKELLRLAASGASPQRLTATRYTACREALMRSEVGDVMPGFLRQCLTLYRFHDFIHLYTPEQSERLALIETALRGCESKLGLRRSYDVFGDLDSGPLDF